MSKKSWIVATVIFVGGMVGADEKQPVKPGETIEITELEKAVLDLTNKAREEEKLPPLKPNAILFKAAREHTLNMIKQNKMDHVLDGKKPSDRTKEAGYKSGWIGENIAAGQGWLPHVAFKVWMESPGHKANILNRTYSEIGIGVSRSTKGEYFYTQVFGGRPKN
jgi:uncharacterized protein YkwD